MRDGRFDGEARRWPLERIDPLPLGRERRALLVLALVVASTVTLPVSATMHVLVGFATLMAFGVPLWMVRRSRRMPEGSVTFESVGVVRHDGGGRVTLARWDEIFGLTVVANPGRTRVVLAFTTLRQTRHIPVRVGGAAKADAAEELLARAVTVPDGDLPAERRAPLAPSSAAELVRALAARSAGVLERICLSDTDGHSVVLDDKELRVGERVFDLEAPLEWRGLMFHESGANAGTIYQGTWVRQGATEVVLVAPMPEELARSGRASRPGLNPREQRLMQSLPDTPPPRELRVAIERLFVVPLRHAIDRAPRMSRAGVPSRGAPRAIQT